MEFPNNLTAGSALPDHELKPEKSFIGMLLHNLDPCKGHVNRSRYALSDMTPNTLHLTLATGSKAGSKLCLLRVSSSCSGDSFHIHGFLRTQSLARVCFGITAIGVQVRSFSGALGLHLRKILSSYEQLYVALSRATHSKLLHVLCPTFPLNRNGVHPKLLQNWTMVVSKQKCINKTFSFVIKSCSKRAILKIVIYSTDTLQE